MKKPGYNSRCSEVSSSVGVAVHQLDFANHFKCNAPDRTAIEVFLRDVLTLAVLQSIEHACHTSDTAHLHGILHPLMTPRGLLTFQVL